MIGIQEIFLLGLVLLAILVVVVTVGVIWWITFRKRE
jgi:hypothetical protein